MIELADLKEYLGIADTDTSEDEVLTTLEANAMAFVENQTRRYFGPPAQFEEFIDGTGLRRLWLSEKPIEAPDDPGGVLVTLSVTTYPGSSSEALVEDTDFLTRLSGHEGMLIRMGSATVWTLGSEYAATYYRGYEPGAEPGDIRQLILDLISVKRQLKGQEGLRSETIGGYSYTRFGNTDMDAVMGGWATIEAWRRPVFA